MTEPQDFKGNYYKVFDGDKKNMNEISILSFWHKLEFFSPFDAKQPIDKAIENKAYRSFSVVDLKSLPQNQSVSAYIPKPPNGMKFNGASIYFNLFDASKISENVQNVLKEELSEEEQFSLEELGANDGITCFARLKMAKDGSLDIEEIELSTVPWALGLISQYGLNALDADKFDADCKLLKEKLSQYQQDYANSKDDTNKANSQYVLSPAVLLGFIDALNEWAYGCSLIKLDAPVIGICMNWVDKPNEENLKNEQVENNEKIESNAVDKSNEDESNDDDEDNDTLTDDIGILNSFYVKDIRNIVKKIEQGDNSPALTAYLKMKPDEAKTDLYSDAGNLLIWQNLQPKYWNKGRWLSEPAHGLSLMQQFAVNTFFKEARQPLFSVNGPPGTGKTTLLRDIFAENIVQRAIQLAKLLTATDAFSKNLEGGIKLLKPELTGFEMVVASSNNAAVENISSDLPKKKSLAKQYQAEGQYDFSYLEPVIRNLSAKQRKKYIKLSADTDIWGLFSSALGKKANRNKVADGLFFISKDNKGYNAQLHKTLWQWRDDYKGVTFAQAKQDFRNELEIVERKLNELQNLFELHEDVVLNNNNNQLQQKYGEANGKFLTANKSMELAKNKLNQAHRINPASLAIDDVFLQVILKAEADIKNAEAVIEDCHNQMAIWNHKIQSLDYSKPGFFARFFQSQQYQAHRQSMAECHDALAKLHQTESASKQSLQQHFQALQTAKDNQLKEQKRIYEKSISDAESEVRHYEELRLNYHKQAESLKTELDRFNKTREKYQDFLNQFPQIKLPASLDELLQNDFQIAGLWQDDELNHHRSCLFGYALKLHEAWLAEVSKKGCGFSGNVSKLGDFIKGSTILNNEQTLAMWQSLFMVVPVVSSTFASFAKQFQSLNTGGIGYLFIDEAGQAVPQAAAGAIWRAKRVMAVGDPIQIEPVFTTPIPLVRHLEAISGIPEGVNASPHNVSVQILADEYNRFGANVTQNNEPVWIGSPLRVHRRCLEPMFGIANKIAYEDKMILSETNLEKHWPKKEGLYLGESSWIQVVGETSSRQFVQVQADIIIQMLIQIIAQTQELPDLYIITPFKQIKYKLIEQILANDTLKSTKGLKTWCDTRIGTVHTFQGKEERMVWFVLGCDTKTDSAAQWAANKPNLLNVALTRAKRYVFIIGDKQVWADKPYFNVAIQTLPEISGDVFLSQSQALLRTPNEYSNSL